MSPDDLLAAARDAAKNAYAPYSGFAVGAALLTADGRVFRGANMENASYGLSLCAECAAISAAVTGGARTIETVAVIAYVIAEPERSAMATPCGRCRQLIAEFASPSLVVYVENLAGTERLTIPLDELLPHPFRLDPPETPTPPSAT